MATYKSRIEEYLGSVGVTAADETMCSNWLTDVAREILAILPNTYLEFFTETKTDSDGVAGATLDNCRIIYAEKSGEIAIPKPAAMKARFIDATSIHLATITSPIYYREANKVYMLPGGGSFHVLEFPVIVHGDDYNNYASSDKVPEDIEPLLVYGTAMRFVLNFLSDLRSNLPTLPTISTADLVLLTKTLGGNPIIDISDPLEKAQKLIDDGANIGGDGAAATMSAQYNMSQDDFAKATSYIAAAAQELNRANTMLSQADLNDNPALKKIKIVFDDFTIRLNSYTTQMGQLLATYKSLYEMYMRGLEGLGVARRQ